MSAPNQTPENFFDSRTITAFALILASFIGWQYYMKQRYPDSFAKPAATEATTAPPASETDSGAPTSAVAAGSARAEARAMPPAPTRTESRTSFTSEPMSFELSSRGMGLREFRLNRFKDRAGETVQMGQVPPGVSPLETRLLGHADALDFDIKKVGERTFVGTALVGDLTVTKTVEVVPDQFLLRHQVVVSGHDRAFVGLTTYLAEELETEKRSSAILPQLDKQEIYVETAETRDRQTFTKSDDLSKSWGKVKLASVGSQYFTQTLLDNSPIMPDVDGAVNRALGSASLAVQYHRLDPAQDFILKYDAYLGPKSYALLRSIEPALASVVDFGFFNWIARHIFALLQWIQSIVGNWGVAIICLTLVVRAMVLPFNIYSYKSMRAMQAIQPQLQAVRERYKDDAQTQQLETMKLMRENKVNPVGGCLPVLFQIPIFFALYQVLGHSIELYQAPFGLWIKDLSLKDPFYVLPVLMGITMFLQQRTTPQTTMDPAQQKLLMFMPLLFTGFMVNLPSGLTLYMWVGAVFSVAQQTYFMKSNKAPVVQGNTTRG